MAAMFGGMGQGMQINPTMLQNAMQNLMGPNGPGGQGGLPPNLMNMVNQMMGPGGMPPGMGPGMPGMPGMPTGAGQPPQA